PAPAAAPAPAASGSAPAGFKIHKPVDGYKISSHFGEIAEIRAGRAHGGTDLAIGQGTPIKAAAPGKVVKVGWDPDGYGNYVTIDHGNGWFTRYGHMVEKPSVKEGEVVAADAQIGKVGSTGNSTGPHLHFEVLKGGTAPGNRIDAEPFLSGDKTF
ncbi:MAG: peptidase, partial [Thermoleophilia bacterium]|nr:peptidase [Thermoleophilia bacterium]